jgi:hypothetical protein
MRFRTMVELAAHTDAHLARKDFYRKKEALAEKVFRTWYSTANQWISEKGSFGGVREGELPGGAGGRDGGKLGASSSSAAGGRYGNIDGKGGAAVSFGAGGNDEEFIVPADEDFVRCPITGEPFESVWDQDEGEFMYRNAVKVLVTEKSDPSIYALGKGTTATDIRYIIVHKLLVLDAWLAQGRADSLKNAKLRYAQMLGQADVAEKCALLTQAADDEDDEDVFVLLELV